MGYKLYIVKKNVGQHEKGDLVVGMLSNYSDGMVLTTKETLINIEDLKEVNLR